MEYKTFYTIDAGLCVGPHPAHSGTAPDVVLIDILREYRVSTIIDLTSPADGLVQPLSVLTATLPGLTIHSFPIPDMGVPSYPLMHAVLDAIDAARAAHHVVYLHCKAGIGRSGLTVACWLIRHGAQPVDAIAQLATHRGKLHAVSPAPESAIQREFVHAWAEPSQSVATDIRTFRDRFRGTLLGLVVGDCLGVPFAFAKHEDTFVTSMQGAGPSGLGVGEWTDRTSMALYVADSIVSCGGFDAHDQIQGYLRWQNEGHWPRSSTCFDSVKTVSQAPIQEQSAGMGFLRRTDPMTAGHGSLLRLAPILMAFGYDAAQCADYAAQSARTTHGAATTVDACQLYARYLAAALQGVPKDAVLQVPGLAFTTPEIQAVASGSFLTKQPPTTVGSDFEGTALEAALWAFASSDTYATATRAAVNLGHDAHTTGAICGMLAGAYYGESGIPAEWLDVVVRRREIEWLAEELLRVSWPHWKRTFGAV
ncbi:MAG: ADP-ribosyl-[dinitrogen reductase] hydrolase [Chloroflexota bacterium]